MQQRDTNTNKRYTWNTNHPKRPYVRINESLKARTSTAPVALRCVSTWPPMRYLTEHGLTRVPAERVDALRNRLLELVHRVPVETNEKPPAVKFEQRARLLTTRTILLNDSLRRPFRNRRMRSAVEYSECFHPDYNSRFVAFFPEKNSTEELSILTLISLRIQPFSKRILLYIFYTGCFLKGSFRVVVLASAIILCIPLNMA